MNSILKRKANPFGKILSNTIRKCKKGPGKGHPVKVKVHSSRHMDLKRRWVRRDRAIQRLTNDPSYKGIENVITGFVAC